MPWVRVRHHERTEVNPMPRRTLAIAAALSVLALGLPFGTASANPLANNSFNGGVEKYEQGDYQGAITDFTKAIEINPDFVNAFLPELPNSLPGKSS